MMKKVSRVFLMFILLSSLALASCLQVIAEAPGIIVIIGSDTTWAKADSPHTLTGPVFVANGATLTIEAGAAVDLNGYYITVNGTLVVLGTSSERIQITNGEKLEFTEFSNGWNEQTESRCILRGASVSCPIVSGVSLKLDNCTVASLDVDGAAVVSDSEVGGRVTVGSSSEISDSVIGEHVFVGSSSVICNNNVSGNVIGEGVTVSNNTVMGIVSVDDSTVSNNIIMDGISGKSLTITGNVVTVQEHTVSAYVVGAPAIRISGGTSVISGNTLNGGGAKYDMGFRYNGVIGALEIGSSSAVISNNVINGKGMYLIGNCESLVITNNTINSGIFCSQTSWEGERGTYNATSFEISGNTITGKIEVSAATLSVSYNRLIGSAGTGIEFSVYGTEITSMTSNTITGFFNGISGSNPEGVLIEKNLITNNMRGIVCTDNHVVIQNNTITNNTIGIYEGASSTIIRYNNIENNTEHSIYLETTSDNIDASNNWWGTTDLQTINVTIRDHKYDFDLGTVTFTPFLTEPNPEAIPTEIPEFSSIILFSLFLTATLVAIMGRKRLAKS